MRRGGVLTLFLFVYENVQDNGVDFSVLLKTQPPPFSLSLLGQGSHVRLHPDPVPLTI